MSTIISASKKTTGQITFLLPSIDFDSVVALVATLVIIALSLHFRSPKQKGIGAYTRDVLGGRPYLVILNVVFLGISFLAVWSSIRAIGFGFLYMLRFEWSVPAFILNLMDDFGLILIAFLAMTLFDLTKKHSSKGLATSDVIKTGIIAVVIALLQLLPQITMDSTYNNWVVYEPGSPYLLVIITAITVASLFILSLAYYKTTQAESKMTGL